MMDRWKKFIPDILGFCFQAGGVYTWVKAPIFFMKNILIDQQAHMIFRIIHKSHDADRTRCNVQVLFHVCGICKGQTGRTYLLTQVLCFKRFFARHEQKVKICFLTTTKKKIFTYMNAKDFKEKKQRNTDMRTCTLQQDGIKQIYLFIEKGKEDCYGKQN